MQGSHSTVKSKNMPRLFTAIDIPEETKISLQKTFRRNPSGLKWVNTEQLHLTIRFIGETDDDVFKMIKESLQEIQWKPLALVFGSAGFFPSDRKPRIFHLGLNDDAKLGLLRKNIDLKLMELEIAPEKRDFIPHLTLARIGDTHNQINTEKLSRDFKIFEGVRFIVTEFHLYSSILTPTGAIHKIEGTYRCSTG